MSKMVLMANDNKKRKILAVDDNPVNLQLLEAIIKRIDDLEIVSESNERFAVERAVEEKPDLILMDVMMPEMDGFEVCTQLKANVNTANIPVIFLTANSQTGAQVTGYASGAVDYITKPFEPEILISKIRVVLNMIGHVEHLLNEANTDKLTGLYNRRYLQDILGAQFRNANLKDQEFSLMMADVDYFKSINDTYGHLTGDLVLKRVAQVIKSNLYVNDILVRYGGEEFLIILKDTDIATAAEIGEKIRAAVEKIVWEFTVEPVAITISIGAASNKTVDSDDCEELVRMADRSLYVAKNRGRNNVVCNNQIGVEDEEMLEEQQTASELRDKVHELAAKLKDQLFEVLKVFVKTQELRSPYLARQSKKVAECVRKVGVHMGVFQRHLDTIYNAALMHNVGKLSLPDSIIQCDKKLTEDEIKKLRKHPRMAADILGVTELFRDEKEIILHHQEYFDGTGYPRGVAGREIPFGSRLLLAAVTWDAILSGRGYRDAKTVEETLSEFKSLSGKQLDPQIVEAFIELAEMGSFADTYEELVFN